MNEKKTFKPGDKFLLELGEERRMFDEFEIAGTDLYVRRDLLEKLTPYTPTAQPNLQLTCNQLATDTISRQAAIDAVLSVIPYDDYWKEEVEKAVNNLPSTQPEIIRCKDCDYWNERQGRMYCGEMYFDQDDPNFYCGFAERRTDG